MENIFNKFSPLIEDTVEVQIDSTYVKAHQHSAVLKRGLSKGRNWSFTRRINQ